MGWERRGNRRYYYRARRASGRVVKEYVGSGPEAEAAARRDAEGAARDRELRRKRGALVAAIRSLEDLTELLVAATMCAAGYHKPKRGPWRKKRVKS
jgi:hypothetical protein